MQKVYDGLYSSSLNGNNFYQLKTMERRMPGNGRVRCEVGEKLEITSKAYLSLYIYNSVVPTLKERGYKVYRVNLLDFHKSNCYNPLEYVTNGIEAMSLAETII